jgi:hypothetical protein
MGIADGIQNIVKNKNDPSATDLDDAANVLEGATARKAPDLPVVTADFQNASDLDVPADGVINVPVPPDGSAPAPTTTKIELLHFGRVFLANAQTFQHDQLDDTQAQNFTVIAGGKGLMFRAAVVREALLVSLFLKSFQAAVDTQVQQKGGLGEITGMLGNLFGGGASLSNQLRSSDLDPYLAKVNQVILDIDKDNVDYATLHKAGITLHEVRVSYRKFLEAQRDKLTSSPIEGAAGPGALANLPFMASALPPEIGKILDIIQKLMFKAQDVHCALLLEFAMRFETGIEGACCDITEQAIRGKWPYAYPIWFLPPDKDPLINPLPASPKVGSFDPLGGARNTAQGWINEINKVDAKVNDFLVLPEAFTRGRPFVEKAFQFNGGTGPLDAGSVAIIAADAFGRALGVPIEKVPVVEKIVGGIAAVLLGFLRNIYSRLLTVPTLEFNVPEGKTKREAFQTAGDTALAQGVIDVALQALSILGTYRNLKFSLLGKDLSLERAIQKLADELGPMLSDPLSKITREAIGGNEPPANAAPAGGGGLMAQATSAVSGALGLAPGAPPAPLNQPNASLYDLLESTRRQVGDKGLTMEAYFGVLPAALALTFQKVFFPFWDLIVAKVIEPAKGPLDDVAKGAAGAMQMGSGLVRSAQNELDKVSKGIDYFDKGMKLDTKGGNLGQLNDIMSAPGAFKGPAPAPIVMVPLVDMTNRTTTGTAKALTDADVDAVKDNKWKADGSTTNGATNGSGAPGGGAGSTTGSGS